MSITRRWDKSKIPTGAFFFNRDCPQAVGMVGWWPFGAEATPTFAENYAGRPHMAGTTNGMLRGQRNQPLYAFTGTQSLTGAQSIITASHPVTMHAFAAVTTPATTQCFFSLGQSGQEHGLFSIASKATALTQATSGNSQANGATTLVSGVMNGIGGIFTSGTDRKVFLNGTQDGTNAVSRIPDPPTGITFGIRGSGTQGFTGTLGECCLWNIAVDSRILQRINDPALRFELWYPLRSPRWISFPSAAGATVFIPIVGRGPGLQLAGGRGLAG